MIIEPVFHNNDIPFPQANDLYKVIKYVDKFVKNYHQKSLEHITLDISPRQVSYYKSAAKYLHLLDENGSTEIANFLFKCDRHLLLSGIVKLILDNIVFFEYYSSKNKEKTIKKMKEIYEINETTAIRRFSTVEKWISWCEIIIKENQLEVITRGY